jgi:hypothetical protein
MTVLQSQHPQRFFPAEVALAGLLRAYVQAVAEGSPFAHARGLDFAAAYWALTEAAAESGFGMG